MLLRWSLWLHFTHRQHQSYLLCDKQGFLITNPFMKVMADIKEWLPGTLLLLYSIVGVELPLISVPPTWSDCLKHMERRAGNHHCGARFCFWLTGSDLGIRAWVSGEGPKPARASRCSVSVNRCACWVHRGSEVVLWKHTDPEQWSWAWLLEVKVGTLGWLKGERFPEAKAYPPLC